MRFHNTSVGPVKGLFMKRRASSRERLRPACPLFVDRF